MIRLSDQEIELLDAIATARNNYLMNRQRQVEIDGLENPTEAFRIEELVKAWDTRAGRLWNELMFLGYKPAKHWNEFPDPLEGREREAK